MRYIAHLGWLQSNGLNNVVFQKGAIKNILHYLNGAKLYSCARLQTIVGSVSVEGDVVYVRMCEGNKLYMTQRPALAIGALISFDGATTQVQSVENAAIFLTDDNNHNRFERVLHETIYDPPYGIEGPG